VQVVNLVDESFGAGEGVLGFERRSGLLVLDVMICDVQTVLL
jgi:hypothetical protein